MVACIQQVWDSATEHNRGLRDIVVDVIQANTTLFTNLAPMDMISCVKQIWASTSEQDQGLRDTVTNIIRDNPYIIINLRSSEMVACIRQIWGSSFEHTSRLRDTIIEIIRTNPTTIIHVERETLGEMLREHDGFGVELLELWGSRANISPLARDICPCCFELINMSVSEGWGKAYCPKCGMLNTAAAWRHSRVMDDLQRG